MACEKDDDVGKEIPFKTSDYKNYMDIVYTRKNDIYIFELKNLKVQNFKDYIGAKDLDKLNIISDNLASMTINELNKKDITYKNQLKGKWEIVEMKMAEFIISAKTKFNNQQPFIQKQYPNKNNSRFFNN